MLTKMLMCVPSINYLPSLQAGSPQFKKSRRSPKPFSRGTSLTRRSLNFDRPLSSSLSVSLRSSLSSPKPRLSAGSKVIARKTGVKPIVHTKPWKQILFYIFELNLCFHWISYVKFFFLLFIFALLYRNDAENFLGLKFPPFSTHRGWDIKVF